MTGCVSFPPISVVQSGEISVGTVEGDPPLRASLWRYMGQSDAEIDAIVTFPYAGPFSKTGASESGIPPSSRSGAAAKNPGVFTFGTQPQASGGA